MTATLVTPDVPRRQCRLAERLTDASQLAGRFAHDFDNVLMGVMGFAELAQLSVAEDSEAYVLIGHLLRVAQQGRVSTGQLHRFSHSGRPSYGTASLVAAWSAELADLRNARPCAATIDVAFAERLPDVAMPADDLRATIGAVVANALDAAGDYGTIRATAEVANLDEPVKALPDVLPPGRYLALTVTDDGPGFRPDVLARVAETPFLTTKVRHRGLGLSIALLTLATHGGGLCIGPAEPHGTTATVFLPTHRTDSER